MMIILAKIVGIKGNDLALSAASSIIVLTPQLLIIIVPLLGILINITWRADEDEATGDYAVAISVLSVAAEKRNNSKNSSAKINRRANYDFQSE